MALLRCMELIDFLSGEEVKPPPPTLTLVSVSIFGCVNMDSVVLCD